MPQFDFYSFSGQNFWVLLSFFSFYFFTLYFYLSNFSEIFKTRQKLILSYSSKNTSTFLKLNLYDLILMKSFQSEK